MKIFRGEIDDQVERDEDKAEEVEHSADFDKDRAPFDEAREEALRDTLPR